MPQTARFPLGQILATPGALEALERTGQLIFKFTASHASGVWGDLCEHDAQANDDALDNGGRIFSVYHLVDGTKVWVVTEAYRRATTVLLSSEY